MSLDGRPYRPRSPGDALRAGVAMLGEDRARDGLVLPASVLDNLTLASLGQLSRLRRHRPAAQQEPPSGQVERPGHPAAGPRGAPCACSAAATSRRSSSASGSSAGRASRSSTSRRAASTSPPRSRSTSIIADLADQGLAVLLISSDLPEIIGMSDRILVMRHGRVAGEVPAGEATEERLLAIASGVGGMAA